MKKKYNKLFSGLCDIVLNADRPDAFLEAIADFTNAYSASLWSNEDTTLSKDVFVLKSMFNRPHTEHLKNNTFINIKDDNIVAAIAFKDNQSILGKLGKAPFDADWLSKDYTRDLQKMGITDIVVIPVYDVSHKPLNVLSLYFVDTPQVEIQVFDGIANLLTSTNEAIEKRLKGAWLDRRKDRHEVMAHTRIINSKLEGIRDLIIENRQNFPEYRSIVHRYNSTIKSINVLRNSYKSANFKERVSERHLETEYIDLATTLEANLRATLFDFKGHGDIVAGEITGFTDCELLFNPDDFSILIDNLYLNAIKYSVPGSSIRTNIKKIDTGIRVTIKNDVAVEEDENLDDIWHYEKRGEKAIHKNIEGEGIGLGLASDICDVYNMSFDAKYELSDQKHYTKVFCVILEIPEEIIG